MPCEFNFLLKSLYSLAYSYVVISRSSLRHTFTPRQISICYQALRLPIFLSGEVSEGLFMQPPCGEWLLTDFCKERDESALPIFENEEKVVLRR